MRVLPAIAALCVASACHPAPDEPHVARARAAVDSVAAGKRFHPETTTFGDLDADGIDDFAACVGDVHSNGLKPVPLARFDDLAFSQAWPDL